MCNCTVWTELTRASCIQIEGGQPYVGELIVTEPGGEPKPLNVNGVVYISSRNNDSTDITLEFDGETYIGNLGAIPSQLPPKNTTLTRGINLFK